MRIWGLLAVCSATALCGAPSLAPSLASVPLGFEPGVRNSEFVAHAGGLTLVITPTRAAVGESRMRLVGARDSASAQPEDLLAGYTNYLLDLDPRKWRTHVPNYRRLRYRDVYPGIDVVYYGNPRELEFDFIVAPSADPRLIRLALSDPDLRIRLPRVYQNDRAIEARAVHHGRSVTFQLAAFDRSRPLVIDPVLSFATVFGGGGSDQGNAIAVDSTGASYVAGNAFSPNFPIVGGESSQGGSFLAKVSPAGDALVYSTYLTLPIAGAPGTYAIDSSGSVYVASAAYPGPPNALGPAVGPAPLGNCKTPGQSAVGSHIYVARLSPDGTSLVYSGCIGGTVYETPSALAVDGAGNAYVAGTTESPDFPLVNPLPSSPPPPSPGPPKAFVLKLGPDGSLLYSTFFGGSNNDAIRAIAADAAGNIYLTGETNSSDFPLKNAIQPAPPSSFTGFVAKIRADGSDLVYSTYFGGSNNDSVSAIAADSIGNTYIAGSTTSRDLPTTSNARQSKFDGVFAYKSIDGAANWSPSDSGLPGGVGILKIDPRNASNIYAVSSGRLFKSGDRGASWQATSVAPASGLWIDPADSTLFVSATIPNTSNANLLRSRDGGATFTTLNTGLDGYPSQMVFDPTSSSLIYGRWGGAGGGNGNGASKSPDGIYESTDGGDTWKPTGISGAATGCCGLAIDPAHPSTLYASTHQVGLQRSDDGGATWTTIGGDVNQILVDANSTLYTVQGSAILVSPPGGVTVQKVAPASVGTLVIDPTNSSTWYAITYSNSGPGIYKTTDGGDTWQRVGNGLPNSPSIGSLAIDPSVPGTLYLGVFALPDGFFAKLSSDGSSLAYATYLGGNGADSVTVIATDSAGNAYLAGTTNSSDFPTKAPFRTAGAGTDGFVAKFDPANTLVWSSPLGGATPRAIALGPAGEVYLTGSTSSAAFPTANSIQPFISGNFFWSGDAGATWTASSPTMGQSRPLTPAVAVDPKTPSRVFALADRLYLSNDRGQSWTPLGSPLGNNLYPAPLIPFWSPALVLDPLAPTTMYASGGCQVVTGSPPNCGVSKSTDGGVTWTLSPITAPGAGSPPPVIVNGLAIDPKTPSILYASTFNAGIYKSVDGGATWGQTGSLITTNAVAVDPLNPAVVYASFGAPVPPPLIPPGGGAFNPDSFTVYKSTDAGATFTAAGSGLPSPWLGILVADPAVPGRVYAVGSYFPIGLYRTDNGGSQWMAIGSGLPAGPINALAVDPGYPSIVYAAPSAGGLYRSTDAGATFTLMPGLRIPIVNAIALDPTSASWIYAGTQFNLQDAFVMKIAP